MSAYFITGTGTGIGKTFTACALLAAARARGKSVMAYKPVISGWDDASDSDTRQIIAAAGTGTVAETSPWRFSAPLSPHRAAAREGTTIDFPELIRWSQTRARQPGLILMEGAGGIMAPLTDRHTVLDWMRALNLPVLLVTGSYLGAISHTLTAIEMLQQAKLNLHALVMNESAESTVPFDEAQAGLAPFTRTIALQIFQPRVSSWAHATAIHALVDQLQG